MFKIKRSDDEIDITVDIDLVNVIAFVAGFILVRRALQAVR